MYEWMEKYIDKCRNKLFYYKKKKRFTKEKSKFPRKE
mgnify:CR=1 FL=1